VINFGKLALSLFVLGVGTGLVLGASLLGLYAWLR
jgi:hypothetical protein